MKRKWFLALFRRRIIIALLLIIQFSFLIYLLTSSSKSSVIINRVLTAISFCVALAIVSRTEKKSYKLIWVFLILAFPIFGGLFYLLFIYQSSTTKFSRKVSQMEEKARKLLPLPGTGYDDATARMPHCLAQINYLQNHAGFPIFANSSARYLSPGEVKLEYLLKELQKAEKYIFLEYFIIQEGVMWDSILEILKQKAAQGVLVRLLYDDLGCFLLLPQDYPEQMRQFGIETAIFNTFKPLLTTIQNNRDHRKICVIDGKVAFTGGINLADEYINAYEKYGHWKDASIMVEGKAAWSFTLIFLQMWELCWGTDEDYSIYYPWRDAPCPIHSDGFVQPYADSPMDAENVGEHVYLQIINNAKQYVYINTPYLIIDDSMVSALTLAAKSGVDVRIVTPYQADKWFVHMTSRSYYSDLINAGVKIYEYSKGFMHSKTFAADDQTAVVGTTNLDFRSLYLHFECGVLMYESKAVMEVKDDFLNTLQFCWQVTPQDCQYNIFKKILQNILRLLAPLM